MIHCSPWIIVCFLLPTISFTFIHFHPMWSNMSKLRDAITFQKDERKHAMKVKQQRLKSCGARIPWLSTKPLQWKYNLQNKNYMIKYCGQNAVLMLSQYWDTCKQITGSENTMVFSLRDVLTMFWWFRKWIDVWMFLFSQLRKRKYSIAVLQYHRSLRYVWSPAVSS